MMFSAFLAFLLIFPAYCDGLTTKSEAALRESRLIEQLSRFLQEFETDSIKEHRIKKIEKVSYGSDIGGGVNFGGDLQVVPLGYGSGLNDEGLDKKRENGAYFVETRSGEFHKEFSGTKTEDANPIEEELHRMQFFVEKCLLNGTDSLIRLLGQLIVETGDSFIDILKSLPHGNSFLKLVESNRKRAYLLDTNRKWDKGIVPYKFASDLNPTSKMNTEKAMKYIEKYSCVRFVHYGSAEHQKANLNHAAYFKYIEDEGCYSYVGRVMESGPQEISPCGASGIGTPLHEILHGIASDHEQSRVDRDEWIQVMYSNMKDGRDNVNFRIEKMDTNVPYDYSSVMQYGLKDFSTNGKPVMSVYDNRLEFLVGERNSMSFYDIEGINLYYGCTKEKCRHFSTECQNEGFVGFVDGVCQCVCPIGFRGADCSQVVDNGCGVNYELKLGEKTMITSPKYPKKYGNDLECFYHVKAPVGSFIRIQFRDLDVEHVPAVYESLPGSQPCYDSVEVRHHLLGQAGIRYCGSYFTGSMISDSNQVMVIFRSDELTAGRGFKIEVTALSASDFNYEVKDRGLNYKGKVSHTVRYDKCLKWSEVRNCPVYYGASSYQTGLGDHSYCRNPTRAEQPWCYTDANLCTTDVCDVSGIYPCHDVIDSCDSKIRTNPAYCTTDQLAFKHCHKSCDFCQKFNTPVETTGDTAVHLPTTSLPLSCFEDDYECEPERVCIPEGKVCDGSDDCSDGGDEEDCDGSWGGWWKRSVSDSKKTKRNKEKLTKKIVAILQTIQEENQRN